MQCRRPCSVITRNIRSIADQCIYSLLFTYGLNIFWRWSNIFFNLILIFYRRNVREEKNYYRWKLKRLFSLNIGGKSVERKIIYVHCTVYILYSGVPAYTCPECIFFFFRDLHLMTRPSMPPPMYSNPQYVSAPTLGRLIYIQLVFRFSSLL